MRIAALDLMRFFAALFVVLYHYISRPETNVYSSITSITNYGYLGVPIFFIISGYVIALSANNRTALQFAISRFVRLYPALWAGATFTAIITFLVTDDRITASQLLANFTLLNEYIGIKDIDGVYWTLKQELKFYACIFLLLAFGIFHKFHLWLTAWLTLAIMHLIFNQPFFMGWFISPSYSLFFIAGISFFLIESNGKTPFNLTILLTSVIGASFRVFEQASGFIPGEVESSEQFIAVIIMWGSFLFFYLLCTKIINLQNRNIYIFLGSLTYPLYLIHNKAGKILIDYFSKTFPEELILPLVLIIMLLISWCINVFIEKPISTPLKSYLLKITPHKNQQKIQ